METIASSTTSLYRTRNPIPHLQDISISLHGASIFPHWTLSEHAIRSRQSPLTYPRQPSSLCLASSTSFTLSFGLRNAAQTLQRCTDQILQGLSFSYACLNSLLIAGWAAAALLRSPHRSTEPWHRNQSCWICLEAEHLEFCHTMLTPLASSPLRAKFRSSVTSRSPPPSTSYMSLLGWLTSTTASFPTVLSSWCPLTLCSPPLSTATPPWTGFLQLSQLSPSLRMPLPMHHSWCIPSLTTCIVMDASDTAVRAVPRQRVGHDWSPIAFFSKKLQPKSRK